MKNIEFHDIPEEDYTYFVCIINSIINIYYATQFSQCYLFDYYQFFINYFFIF